MEASYYGITACDKDVVIRYYHGFDGFLTGHKTLGHFVFLQIYYPHHLVPGSCEHQVEGHIGLDHRNWISKLKYSVATSSLHIPLPDSAIISCRKQKLISRYQMVYAVSVANEGVTQLSALHVP